MQITLNYLGEKWVADLNKGTDISIAAKENNPVNCFHAPPFYRDPVVSGDFIGSTKIGGLLNFYNLHLNPHGNCTHTESVQHLDHRGPSINNVLLKQHFHAYLLSIKPRKKQNGEFCIHSDMLDAIPHDIEALIIRTKPNNEEKLHKNYSGSAPPYIDQEAMEFIAQRNIMHLLVDLPSVDPEVDGGKLIAHKTFWNYPATLDSQKSITELVFIPNNIKDGHYILNLNPAPIVNDASPSKPVIYPLKVV